MKERSILFTAQARMNQALVYKSTIDRNLFLSCILISFMHLHFHETFLQFSFSSLLKWNSALVIQTRPMKIEIAPWKRISPHYDTYAGKSIFNRQSCLKAINVWKICCICLNEHKLYFWIDSFYNLTVNKRWHVLSIFSFAFTNEIRTVNWK